MLIDVQIQEELIEEIDLLKLTTGDESSKTNDLKQKEKEKSIEQNQSISQQVLFYFSIFYFLLFLFKLIMKLEILEIKLELGYGSSTRPVVAICLSELFADIQNWSSDVIILNIFFYFYLLFKIDFNIIINTN